jgi:predicted dehydrogenase
MAKLKAAIIGSGLISRKKHIPAFLRQKGRVEITALCDRNIEAAQTVRRDFGIGKFYLELSELLDEQKPDIVDICTPPRTHAKLAIEAIRRGCHVLIEKPMAMTVSECDEIVEAAREYQIKACVAHSDLFYHPFMKARQLVREGRIGEFRGMRILLSTPTDYMTSRSDHWAHKLPGGVFGETGPHAVYMTLAFINPVESVSVQRMKILDYPWSRCEDYRIELAGEKAMSSILLSYASNQWMALVDILGSEGCLLVDLQGLSLVKYHRTALTPWGIARSMLSNSLQGIIHTCANAVSVTTGRLKSTHETIVERFLDSILEDRASPVSAEEGREAVRVMNRVVEELGTSADSPMTSASPSNSGI